jgi:hypothetical protein
MPIPPVKRTAGRVELCASVIQPKGPWRRSSLPRGNELRVRLKTVVRRRMATIRFRSCGALAMERARVLPSRSVWPGLSKIKLKNCPASNSNSSGFSKQKAVVPALGDNDQAMNCLEKGYEERFNPGVLLRPGFDPLRSDPRFKDPVRRIGFPL